MVKQKSIIRINCILILVLCCTTLRIYANNENRISEYIPLSLDYTNVIYLNDGIARVSINDKGDYIYVDHNNEIINSYEYETYTEVSSSEPIIKFDEDTQKYGYVDADDNWVINPQYYHCDHFYEGFARVSTDTGFGYIDENGNEKIACIYKDAGNFHDNYAAVALHIKSQESDSPSKWAVLDTSGNEVFSLECDYVYDYSDGLFLINKGGKYGYIDITGKVVLNCIYDSATNFKDGIAMVSQNGKCGYINTSGDFLINTRYDTATEFINGYAWVSEDGKYGVLKDNYYEDNTSDTSKELTIQSDGDRIKVLNGNIEIVFTNAQPFIDENGRTQIPIRSVAEALGCKVEWDEQTRTVTLKKNNTVVVITIDNAVMQVGTETVTMDTTAQIVNDNTYIPVRFVGEALGMEVKWESD